MEPELDDVDRAILHLLQIDARNTTAREIADKVGVSPSTVRNRIDELEAAGVIAGYHPEIDYEAAGLQLRTIFVITAPPAQRTEVIDDLMDVKGVVDVREMLTGRRNVHVEVVSEYSQDLARATDAIHDLGLEIESSELLRQHRSQPFDHFTLSADAVGGGPAGDDGAE